MFTPKLQGTWCTSRTLQYSDLGAPDGDGIAAAEELEIQELIPAGSFIRVCDCMAADTVRVDDIRGISDEFCADGNAASEAGLSNMVWGFGQFLDEDSAGLKVDTDTDTMEVHRAVTSAAQACQNSLNVHTPQIDAGPIYGSDEEYVQSTLREPGTCALRASEGGFLPLTTIADDTGSFFFLAGDVRVSEHAFLAAQYTVWLREHNRLCAAVDTDPELDGMSAGANFNLVRNVVIAKLQQVVLTEFLPALGITQAALRGAEAKVRGPGVSVEFSIAYRLGHDLIGNSAGNIDVADAFNSESFFLEQTGTADAPSVTYKAGAEAALGNIMTQLATSSANHIDGKLSDALRNFLFGREEGEDLAGRNIALAAARGRELGIPTYGGHAECFGTAADASVESTTPDAWVGLLKEPKAAGGVLPPTLRAIVPSSSTAASSARAAHTGRTPPARCATSCRRSRRAAMRRSSPRTPPPPSPATSSRPEWQRLQTLAPATRLSRSSFKSSLAGYTALLCRTEPPESTYPASAAPRLSQPGAAMKDGAAGCGAAGSMSQMQTVSD
eukprot:jgi/Ulvmu1/3850/UM018_0067.1